MHFTFGCHGTVLLNVILIQKPQDAIYLCTCLFKIGCWQRAQKLLPNGVPQISFNERDGGGSVEEPAIYPELTFFSFCFHCAKECSDFLKNSKVTSGPWEAVQCGQMLESQSTISWFCDLGEVTAYFCLCCNIGIIIVLLRGLLKDSKHAKPCEQCTVRTYYVLDKFQLFFLLLY